MITGSEKAKMFRKTLIIISFIWPICSHAEPVYLDCKVSSGDEKKSFSVRLDESTGKITHTNSDTYSFNANGFFSAKTIAYKNIIVQSNKSWIESYNVNYTFRYEIDRNSLEISEIIDWQLADFSLDAQNPPNIHSKMTGTCSVLDVKDRKI